MTGPQEHPADMARLRWQCRRGMLELDELLLRFLEGPFLQAGAASQAGFRQLLQAEDPLLNAWLILGQSPAPIHLVEIVAQVRAHNGCTST